MPGFLEGIALFVFGTLAMYGLLMAIGSNKSGHGHGHGHVSHGHGGHGHH